MRITFCGTGAGGSINPERANSSIHLTHDEVNILLDCGPGFMERMIRAELDPDHVVGVVYSHLHFDHAMGIAELFSRLIARTGPPVQVFGPRDTDTYIEAAIAFARVNATRPQLNEWLDGVRVELTRPDDQREIGPWSVRSVEVPHVPNLECLARRFEVAGRSLVYSGDSTYAPDAMVPLADGADVLIHEAFSDAVIARTAERGSFSAQQRERFTTAMSGSHSRAEDVGRTAQAAGVRRLVLTHLLAAEREDDLLAEAGREFDGEISVAADGMTFEV